MPHTTRQLSTQQILICGAAIVTVSMGIRHGFGLWLQPITQDRNWGREPFALALALQNLVGGWPVFLPACWPTGLAPFG